MILLGLGSNLSSSFGDRFKNIDQAISSLKDYGINLVKDDNQIIVDTLKWNGLAKKNGMQTGDIISEFKVENLSRPNKSIIYPIALILLLIFGYLNYKRKNS